MQRRRVLTATGGLLVGLAGCMGRTIVGTGDLTERNRRMTALRETAAIQRETLTAQREVVADLQGELTAARETNSARGETITALKDDLTEARAKNTERHSTLIRVRDTAHRLNEQQRTAEATIARLKTASKQATGRQLLYFYGYGIGRYNDGIETYNDGHSAFERDDNQTGIKGLALASAHFYDAGVLFRRAGNLATDISASVVNDYCTAAMRKALAYGRASEHYADAAIAYANGRDFEGADAAGKGDADYEDGQEYTVRELDALEARLGTTINV